MSIQKGHVAKFAAMALLASSALMQGAEHGTFHLPMEAHWGKTVLQPGDYKVILPAPSLGEFDLRVECAGKIVYRTAARPDAQPLSNSSSLKLTNINGQYVVTEFSSGATGQVFEFPLPKASRRLTSTIGESGVSLAIR